MIRYFDSHAHYEDIRFENEYEGGQRAVLSYVFSEGIDKIVNVGSSVSSSRKSVELAKKYPGIYCAVGIHPSDCGKFGDIYTELEQIEKLAANEKVVAIGEIGFDYHYDDTDKRKQKEWFDAQLSLAAKLKLPVIIHDKEAHSDCLDMISMHKDVTGVFHSYSGSSEMVKDVLGRGYIISVSGVVTYKNNIKTVEVVKNTPIEYIMSETDCPYLPPVPYRGMINHSAYMKETVKKIAEIKGDALESVAEKLYGNAMDFYGIRSKQTGKASC